MGNMTTDERFDTIILPTYGQVIGYRTRMAAAADPEKPDPLFGVSVTTFDGWLADLWELYGDGRTLAGPMERTLAMVRGFEEADLSVLSASDGAVLMAARCVGEAAGLPAFESALDAARSGQLSEASDGTCAPYATLIPAEKELLRAMARCRDALNELGFVEPGEALSLLPAALPTESLQSVLVEGLPPLSHQQQRFFEACPQFRVTLREATGADGVVPPSDGVDVRFAFPSGCYARPRLLADLVDQLRGEGLVVFACKDPRETYQTLAPAFVRDGVTCAMRARIPFADTDFGRVFFALRRLIGDEEPQRADLTDILYSPLLGLSQSQVQKLDARLRGDRLVDLCAECALLRAENEVFSYLEDIASDPEATVLIGALEDRVRTMPGVSEAYRREQLGALALVRETCQVACRMQLDMDAAACVLSSATVDASRQASVPDGTEAPSVLICDVATAATLGARSCATLVLCDMDNAHRPVVDRDDATTALLEKLGIMPVDDALSYARRQFRALEAVPQRHLILERCLFDADAEPTYPAMVVEELVDCYREDPSATDDIDNPYLLPLCLQKGLIERGEELLYENAAVTHAAQPLLARIARPDAGEVSQARRSLVVLPRPSREGAAPEPPRLSASQIESYLACPYLWFAQRRLRVEPLDEGFGPLQMGDFAHHVLERFYRTFQEQTGASKVTPAHLAEARAIMSTVLDEQAALQFSLKPADNRLVPRSHIEQREVEELKRHLMSFLDFEAQLLPTFQPAHFEFKVGASGEVDYAGVKLVGVIDRIDIDDAGRAVIIDYKGSVSYDYELTGKDRAVPAKVQTLIYAQVIRRTLGLDVVGALYLGYGKKPKLAGAYDARMLEAVHLPNMRHERCQYTPVEGGSFNDLLDQTEERAAYAVRALLSGEVPQAPSGPGACAWCPVSACTAREA
ncbi:PD-(D/E)XK nuclease family protein [Eggerthella sp. YY7918]|uniref:PD-(D/E)XK nuclease family protein n=1 Tax=Eggerthella sp. (strain YY7918) TaxID=502558 RepID=UPI0005A1D395|nr:PD-(D/E)XK nuclease family protein [Eggerthella sp. YY7918]